MVLGHVIFAMRTGLAFGMAVRIARKSEGVEKEESVKRLAESIRSDTTRLVMSAYTNDGRHKRIAGMS